MVYTNIQPSNHPTIQPVVKPDVQPVDNRLYRANGLYHNKSKQHSNKPTFDTVNARAKTLEKQPLKQHSFVASFSLIVKVLDLTAEDGFGCLSRKILRTNPKYDF